MKAFQALISAMWRYASGRRQQVVIFFLLSLGANMLLLLEPFVVGMLLNTLQNAAQIDDPLRHILWYLFVLIAIQFSFWLLHGPARVIEQGVAFHIAANMRDACYRTVVSLPVQWHKNNHSGRTINRIGKATRALNDFSSNSYQFIEMVVRLVGSVTALVLLMPMAAVLALSVTVLALLIVFLLDKLLLPRYEVINDHEHTMAMTLHDYVTNITTVITLRLEKLTQSELWKRMTHYFPYFQKTAAIDEFKWFSMTIIISMMTAAVLIWYTITSLGAGALPLAGTFFMLYEYLQRIGTSFYTFAWKYSATIHQYADLRSIDPILQAERAYYHGDYRLPTNWKTIEIRNLDFTYKDEEKREHHLKDVSLTLKHDAKIAFVGESGSGKSTLMTLIRGLNEPDSAEVLCDGKPLKNGLKDVGSTVTLIPQEPEIFENTIEYNITLDTDQSRDEVMDDIKLASFDAVLQKLPKGLETNTAEKGVNLSGGEKQRLALARGFFAAKRSDIILLDEPTSSVDSTNELKIYNNLLKRFKDRCVISSVHKLHLLEMFEEVYVFDQGKLLQHGTFRELIAKEGRLKELWSAYNRRKD